MLKSECLSIGGVPNIRMAVKSRKDIKDFPVPTRGYVMMIGGGICIMNLKRRVKSLLSDPAGKEFFMPFDETVSGLAKPVHRLQQVALIRQLEQG